MLQSGPDRHAIDTLLEVRTSKLQNLAIKHSELGGSQQFVEGLRIIEQLHPEFLSEQNEPRDGT